MSAQDGMTDQESRPNNNRREDGCSLGILKFDPSYVRDQWDGRIKLAEIIFTLLAGACLPGTVYSKASAFSFFSFVVWTTFINACIDMVLHLSSLWGRLMYICRAPEVYLVLCSVACGSFLLSSALVAGFAHYSINATAAGVAAFFGFLCMVLFGAEAFLIHYVAFRRGKAENVRQEEPDEFAEPI